MADASLFHTTVDPAIAESHCYDVLIVGAGPAGSSAAYHLARQGTDVLLLDRYTFPRDKSCGDAVMPPALEELALSGLSDQLRDQYSSATYISTSLYGLPASYEPVQPSEHFAVGYVVPRASFDALLCQHALQSGATWLDRVVIHSVERSNPAYAIAYGLYGGRALQLRARIVIAADGSGSRLARLLRQELLQQNNTAPLTAPLDPRTRYTAMRGYYSGIEDLKNGLEFYFRAEAGTYYYWIFPLHDGTANVGVIANMTQLRAAHPNLKQSIKSFLQSADLSNRTARSELQGKLHAAPIASGLRDTALYGDHMLCAGDAAALVHPLSAEGISGALISGRLATETALTALNAKDYTQDTLSPYGVALRERYQVLYDGLLNGSMRWEM